ncbi:MAG: ATP-binding protein [Thermoleophilia bacterium]
MRAGDQGALAGIVALVGGAADLEPALGGALDLLAGASGARTAAVYVGDPAAGGLELRAVGGPGATPRRPVTGIRPATAPGACRALDDGLDVTPAAHGDELAGLGLPGGVLIPTRVGGRTVAAVGLSPVAAAPDAEVRAAVQVLGLALRNARLAAGFQDRVRELDRQAVQLGALTEVARRVAGAIEPGEAHRVVAAEARALVRADGAVLLLPGPDGTLQEAASDGAPGTAAVTREVAAEAFAAGGGRRRDGTAAVALPGAGDPPAPGGVLAVARTGGTAFEDDSLERLRGLAGQAAIALSNARLLADLRREQDERRSLAAAIVLAQEQERRRIAEDLHDGPVQELVGVGLLLDALAADIGAGSPEGAGDVERAAGAAREAVRGLRRAIADLHPLVLEQLGFAAAVRALCERLEWSGARVEVDVDPAESLSETRRTAVFRIVQEAVTNIARHAAAERVLVRAHEEGGSLVVEVSDDGRGFDPAAPRAGVAEGHLGLAAIEERARLAGGTLRLASEPGRGTTLRVTLPAGASGDQAGGGSRSSAADSAASSAKRSSTTT